jgi:hypothetical protein
MSFSMIGPFVESLIVGFKSISLEISFSTSNDSRVFHE